VLIKQQMNICDVTGRRAPDCRVIDHANSGHQYRIFGKV